MLGFFVVQLVTIFEKLWIAKIEAAYFVFYREQKWGISPP